jgi:hypothetical protein
VNWGEQLQTSLLVPGTHVPGLATQQTKYRNCNYVKHDLKELYRHCTIGYGERIFTVTCETKVYSHTIPWISVKNY